MCDNLICFSKSGHKFNMFSSQLAIHIICDIVKYNYHSHYTITGVPCRSYPKMWGKTRHILIYFYCTIYISFYMHGHLMKCVEAGVHWYCPLIPAPTYVNYPHTLLYNTPISLVCTPYMHDILLCCKLQSSTICNSLYFIR